MLTLQNMVLIVFSNGIYRFRIGAWGYVQGCSGKQLNAELTALHAKHAAGERRETNMATKKAIMEEEETRSIEITVAI